MNIDANTIFSSSAPVGSARQLLRDATMATHDRVDARMSGLSLATRTDYQRFITVMLRGVLPLEAGLMSGGFADACPGWAPSGPCLIADAEALDMAVSTPADAMPISGAIAWGVAYVLEGSRLGGRVLSKRAGRSDDPSVTTNMRFLTRRHGLRWPDFVTALDCALGDADSVAESIIGAEFAFSLFQTGDADIMEGEHPFNG